MGTAQSAANFPGCQGCCANLADEELRVQGCCTIQSPRMPSCVNQQVFCGADFDAMNLPFSSLGLEMGDPTYMSPRCASVSLDTMVCSESLEKLKNRLSNIAEAHMENSPPHVARAYADVLCRVLDVLVSATSPSAPRGFDLSDPSAIMVVVAAEEQLQEIVCVQEVLVLTKEPAATTVHDDRFEKMMRKLCRGRQSATARRESLGRHIAVSHTSGEIIATSALFVDRKNKDFGLGLIGMRAPDSVKDKGFASPMGPTEVAVALRNGVVFSVVEPGGVAVLPSVDVMRGRAFKVSPKSGFH